MSKAWVPGVTLTSWYRDPATNQRVGGRPDSQHLWGWALDLRKDNAGLRMARNLSTTRYLEVIVEPDHIHIEFEPGVATWLKNQLSGPVYGF